MNYVVNATDDQNDVVNLQTTFLSGDEVRP